MIRDQMTYPLMYFMLEYENKASLFDATSII